MSRRSRRGAKWMSEARRLMASARILLTNWMTIGWSTCDSSMPSCCTAPRAPLAGVVVAPERSSEARLPVVAGGAPGAAHLVGEFWPGGTRAGTLLRGGIAPLGFGGGPDVDLRREGGRDTDPVLVGDLGGDLLDFASPIDDGHANGAVGLATDGENAVLLGSLAIDGFEDGPVDGDVAEAHVGDFEELRAGARHLFLTE